jgi:peptidyl-tRNA hydrolase, PTH1 family
MENFFLIAGLGNPGGEYAATRHNAGFMVVERLAERHRSAWADESKFEARVARIQVGESRVLLVEPQTFMNRSGRAVQAAAMFFKVALERILVVVDDADLGLGSVRMRGQGSPGGHHGLESVQAHLGTPKVARLRVGIGRRMDGVREITGHVLGRFDSDEVEVLDRVLEHAADQAECWVVSGIQKAMNEYNGAVNAPVKKERQ